MGARRSGPRHWETDRLLSEMVLERTRAAAARRAQPRPDARPGAAPPGDAGRQGSTSPRRMA
ncbi:MAG: hypothetical protein R2736_16850 [Solirubrobacterales bacterium]